MKSELTDTIIRKLPAPKRGIAIHRDQKIAGLGVRVLPSGTKSFVLDYTNLGRRRIYTIGGFPELTTHVARQKARELKDGIRYRNLDPAQLAADSRAAPTVDDLCDEFEARHFPKLRISTRSDYGRILNKEIRPKLGSRKVKDIARADIEAISRAIEDRGSPVSANICIAVCSKMFQFAVDERWVAENPAARIKKNPVEHRHRYLSKVEIADLIQAIAKYPDTAIGDIFRLLLLTGARRGEVRSAEWSQFKLADGLWIKPSSHTKQRKEHRVPLAAPARAILVKRRNDADRQLREIAVRMNEASHGERLSLAAWKLRLERFVFPAKKGETGHVVDLKKPWAALCKAAGIPRSGPNAARVHDLRHTAASILVSSGANLPLIGQLLGHSQQSTTARYAHLFDDAQRDAIERLGAIVTADKSAKVVPLRKTAR